MSVKNLDTILWTEKYRPNTLDGCILPKRIKTMLEDVPSSKTADSKRYYTSTTLEVRNADAFAIGVGLSA